MDAAASMVWIGSALAIAGIALLRFAWRQKRRSPRLNLLSWGLVGGGVWLGAAATGAWGVAIVSLAATGCAFVLLTHAAITARPDKARPSARRANLLDEDEPLGLGRRLVTFVLTVPLALAVALALGVAGRALAGLAGWHEANGNVLTLFLMPVAWALLAFLLLMVSRRRTQVYLLLAPALFSALAILIGLPR